METLSPNPAAVIKVENSDGEVIAQAFPIVGPIIVSGEIHVPVEDFNQALKDSLGEFATQETPIIHQG